jgi:hypothetical protein
MSRLFPRGFWMGFVVCAGAIALTAIAAPLGGGGGAAGRAPQIPDEILSLANVKQVRVEFENLPADLQKAGMTSERFQTFAKKKLTDAGIELVTTGDVPVLMIKAVTITDPSVPEATALIFFCDVQQRIKVMRIDRELNVPTCTAIAYATARRDKLGEMADRQADLVMTRLIDYVQMAAKAK